MFLIYDNLETNGYKKIVDYKGLKQELFTELMEHIANNVDMGKIDIKCVDRVVEILKEFYFNDFISLDKINNWLKEFGYSFINLTKMGYELENLREYALRTDNKNKFNDDDLNTITKMENILENIKGE